MRKRLPLLSLISASLLLTQGLYAQDRNLTYSITDGPNQLNTWVQLRTIQLDRPAYSGSLMDGLATDRTVLDAATRKPVTIGTEVNKMGFPEQAPFSSGVAALAYDKKNNRLWYTPMFIDQLRYIDLKTQQVYYVNMPFTGKPVKSSDQGNIVTRMVIASDGYGYAMTNDGSQLIRFSTGKKITITDLGRIADDQSNTTVSIHSSCSSYGGDMVADDDGNLYVFSARNHVFRINTETKVATHLAIVEGLPNGYSINGAAVTANNKIVVASAATASALYEIDTRNWIASPITLNGTSYHTSDLANGNLLVSGNRNNTEPIELMRSKPLAMNENSRISIFPNPVTDNQFVLQFGRLSAGSYTVQVTDVMGRQVLQQQVNTSGENHVQKISLAKSVSKGVYLVKVLDAASNTAYSSKIVVQ
jgi:hypothetical protein